MHWSGNDARKAAHAAEAASFSPTMAAAYEKKNRPFGVGARVLRRISAVLRTVIKRMPNIGPLHDVIWDHFEPISARSGLGDVLVQGHQGRRVMVRPEAGL